MRSLLAFALLLTFTVSFAADAPPPLSAVQAAQIAQDDLESRGLQTKVFPEQIIFKKDGIGREAAYWEVNWNVEFPAKTKGRKEFGLRVFMDGSYKRAVR